MQFFKDIAPLLKGTDLVLTIRGGENQITVSVNAKSTKDNDLQLAPVILSGTPEEIDEAFILTLFKPISNASRFFVEHAEFEEQLKQKQADMKKKKDAKEIKSSDKKSGTDASKVTQSKIALDPDLQEEHEKCEASCNGAKEDEAEDENVL